MNSASGRGGRKGKMPADVTRHTGRHLLTRQPQTLATKVPLDGVVISQLKQEMPVFHASELASLCQRFGKTAFEKQKQTIELHLKKIYKKNSVEVVLTDQCKTIPQLYKKRELTVPIEAVGDLLKSVSGEGIIRSVGCYRPDDALLKALLQAKKLTPVCIHLPVDSDSTKEYLVPVLKRLAETGEVKSASFFFCAFVGIDIDWQQVQDCLAPFTTLQRLQVWTDDSPPPSDWLKKAITANSQLKKLNIGPNLFFSPVVADAVSTIGRVRDICIENCNVEELMDHVELDLCGAGQCTLTKLALVMPETGRLKWEMVVENEFRYDDDFYGDFLRLGYYLLSLHKTGIPVAVEVLEFPGRRIKELAEDLSRFFPLTETKIGAGGRSYAYRMSIGKPGKGKVSIKFYTVGDEEDDEEEVEEEDADEENELTKKASYCILL